MPQAPAPTEVILPGPAGPVKRDPGPENQPLPGTRASHGSVRTDPATWRTGSKRSIGFAFPAVSVTL